MGRRSHFSSAAQKTKRLSNPAARAGFISFISICGSQAGFCVGVRLMYTELHARSAFSFLAGASLPEELASVCAERNMDAMAMLDRDGMYGAPRFYMAAKKSNVRALIGAEVTSEEGWRYSLLVESRSGYQNVCR